MAATTSPTVIPPSMVVRPPIQTAPTTARFRTMSMAGMNTARSSETSMV